MVRGSSKPSAKSGVKHGLTIATIAMLFWIVYALLYIRGMVECGIYPPMAIICIACIVAAIYGYRSLYMASVMYTVMFLVWSVLPVYSYRPLSRAESFYVLNRFSIGGGSVAIFAAIACGIIFASRSKSG